MTTQTTMVTPIATNDATHRGIADFYPESALKLKLLLKKKSFDTGWFSCKHESRSARIARFDDQLLLNVQAFMDDGADLIDTLIWEASGGNDFAGSGWDALDKAGFEADESKEKFMDQLRDRLIELDLIFDENAEIASKQIEVKRVTFRRVCDELEALEDQVEQELDRRYQDALTFVKGEIENHRSYERGL